MGRGSIVGVTIAVWSALLIGAAAASFTVDLVGDGSNAAAGDGPFDDRLGRSSVANVDDGADIGALELPTSVP